MPAPDTFTSLADALVRRWRDEPSTVALVRVVGGKLEKTTHAELAARIYARACRLDAVGIGAGDTVAIRSEDKTELLVASLAATLLGAAFVPVPFNALDDLCEELIAMTGAKALVTDREEHPAGVPVVQLGNIPVIELDLERAMTWARRATPRTIYMIQPTSGSTGVPKLVPRRHDAFLRLPWALGLVDRVAVARRILVPLTLEHGGGLYGVAVWLCVGSSMAFPELEDVNMLLDDVPLLAPTLMMMTPRVVTSLFKQAKGRGLTAREALGDSVDALITGGAKSVPEALAWLERSNIQIVEIYGASEFSVITHSPWDAPWSNERVGPLLDDVEARLDDDGELLVKTPVMLTGYVGPRPPRAFTDDGFFRTGDLAELIDGSVRIVGRRRDVLNLFDGSNVYPSVVENKIESLPWVRQVVVVGDQRPALAALIVVHEDLADPGDGATLAPDRYPAHYELVRRELGQLNDQLDASEQVRYAILLREPFPPDILATAAIGKLKRDRRRAAEHFRDALDACYRPDSPYRLATVDRRHHKRFPFTGLVRLSAPSGTWFVYARNLGLRGIKLACIHDVPDEVELIAIGRPLGRALRARVVWRAHGEIGCQFVDPLTVGERELILNKPATRTES